MNVNQDDIPTQEILEPSDGQLLNWLKDVINARTIQQISDADYGLMSAECYAVLAEFKLSGKIPERDWVPVEMLELTRWTEPGNSHDPTTIQGHLARLLSCTLLLRISTEGSNHEYFDGENQTLAQMISSSLYLGGDIPQMCLRFILWFVKQSPTYDEEALFAVAAMILILLSQSIETCNATLPTVLDWFDRANERTKAYWGRPVSDWPSFLGYVHHDSKHSVWISLVETVIGNPSVGIDDELRNKLIAISKSVHVDRS